jgi:hypothetical protein
LYTATPFHPAEKASRLIKSSFKAVLRCVRLTTVTTTHQEFGFDTSIVTMAEWIRDPLRPVITSG